MNLFGFCLSLCLGVVFCEETMLSIKLKRMESPLTRMVQMNSGIGLLKKLDVEYEKIRKNKSNASIPLFKYLDSEFYGEILIGHPGQAMNVIFDTSWANSWVLSVRCPIQKFGCAFHNKYDSSRSSQYVHNGESIIFTAEGQNYSGILSTDLFHLGQMNVTNQTFAEIFDLPWTFGFTKADGVVGLAFYSMSVKKVVPVFYNMIKQGLIENQIFSFYLNRDPSSERGGTLFIGGVEKRHYKGNFTFASVSKANLWQFNLESIYVKGNTNPFCKGGCEAIADTSSNVIQGPEEEITVINQLIMGRPFYLGRYLVDCGLIGKLPTITFMIKGTPFVLKARDYIQKITLGGVMLCMSSFAKSPFPLGDKMWILGGAFLSRFYVQYDLKNQMIGFAEALY